MRLANKHAGCTWCNNPPCTAKQNLACLHKSKLDAAQGSGKHMHVEQVFLYLKLEK